MSCATIPAPSHETCSVGRRRRCFETLLAREDERRRLAREAEEQHQQKTTEETNVLREKNRREFVQSEQGAVAASNAEAERLMHLPTPEYHKLMGSFITDPDKPFGGPDN